MKKVFGIAALLLAFVACNKVETEIAPVEQPSLIKAEGITITAMLAPKTTDTKAVTDGVDKITVTWAAKEHIAILYEVSGTKYVADAEIKSVDASGAATIEFTVESGTPDNTACTLVYPAAAAKDDHTGIKDAATLLAAQNGTLSANLDVRVGEGAIQTTTPGLDVTTQPAAQFAIFKFTVRKADGTTVISASPLIICTGGWHYTITPASATDEFYVALPAVSGQRVIFNATDGSNNTYTCSKDGVSFDAGRYYQSTLKMREIWYREMGDGLKWASCNVGATVTADYGDYFAWGETDPQYSCQSPQYWKYVWKDGKSPGYSLGTYFDADYTRYNVSGKTVLDLADDAARANWGGSWRVPTEAEWKWLLDNCTWEWKTNYEGSGINGMLVTSNIIGYSSNSIFLPAAGEWNSSSLYDKDSYGDYWSSSLKEDSSASASMVYFDETYKEGQWYHSRNCGLSIRPVRE